MFKDSGVHLSFIYIKEIIFRPIHKFTQFLYKKKNPTFLEGKKITLCNYNYVKTQFKTNSNTHPVYWEYYRTSELDKDHD